MWTDSDAPEGIGVATCAAAGLAAPSSTTLLASFGRIK